jgi:hypothetical protein
LLDQQHAGPEQIDKSLAASVFLHGQLKGGDAFVGDAENFKKCQPEGFGVAVLVFCVGPGAAEFKGAAFDFVSTQWHKWPMK